MAERADPKMEIKPRGGDAAMEHVFTPDLDRDSTEPLKHGSDSYKRGGGIHIKASHKGLLHKNLGVPEGKPIPEAKMESAKAGASPAERKRITFAENARHWSHK